MTQNLITSAFELVRDVEHGVLLLDTFHRLAAREVLLFSFLHPWFSCTFLHFLLSLPTPSCLHSGSFSCALKLPRPLFFPLFSWFPNR